MIKSMTGFGRCEVQEGDRKITVEMKSVNHRYLDVTIKMPKKLNFFEAAIRSELKNYIQRGKVDIFITYEDFTESNVCVKYNKELAAEYMNYLNKMAEDFSLDNDIRVSSLARFPEILTMEEQTIDEEELWQLLDKAIKGAAEGFVETRIKEGEHLRDDLLDKLDNMLKNVDFITERSPKIIEEYRQRLEEKVRELLEDTKVDENRLLTEVTIFADKVCVDEELVRLRSHIETTRDTLIAGGSIGRKLDFIAQEMNREANTILSKSNDLEISNHAIELKTEIDSEYRIVGIALNKLIHIGFGNIVNAGKIIAIVSPDSAPVKRMVQRAREDGSAIDATQGRKTKAVLVMENSQLVLSALLPETIAQRAQAEGKDEDET